MELLNYLFGGAVAAMLAALAVSRHGNPARRPRPPGRGAAAPARRHGRGR